MNKLESLEEIEKTIEAFHKDPQANSEDEIFVMIHDNPVQKKLELSLTRS